VIDCCIVFNECVERKKKSAPRSTEVEPHAGRRSPHVGVEPIPFNDIQLPGTILGYGSYGKVERAKWNHMDVVVRFCTEKGTTEEFRAAVRELIELPPHPNVVQVYGFSFDEQQTALVLEYCSGGTLQENLNNVKLFEVVKGIVDGMIHFTTFII
jgi:hypothetical protein